MEKFSEIASNINISVKTVLNHDISIIDQSRFFYNYYIDIENSNSFAVRLLRRHWEIYDSLHPKRVIDGDGVVGLTPILMANERFSYSSGCDLYSEMGKMRGYYVFERLDNQIEFTVDVPEFDLIFFGKMN
jgi:ApaG protein